MPQARRLTSRIARHPHLNLGSQSAGVLSTMRTAPTDVMVPVPAPSYSASAGPQEQQLQTFASPSCAAATSAPPTQQPPSPSNAQQLSGAPLTGTSPNAPPSSDLDAFETSHSIADLTAVLEDSLARHAATTPSGAATGGVSASSAAKTPRRTSPDPAVASRGSDRVASFAHLTPSPSRRVSASSPPHPRTVSPTPAPHGGPSRSGAAHGRGPAAHSASPPQHRSSPCSGHAPAVTPATATARAATVLIPAPHTRTQALLERLADLRATFAAPWGPAAVATAQATDAELPRTGVLGTAPVGSHGVAALDVAASPWTVTVETGTAASRKSNAIAISVAAAASRSESPLQRLRRIRDLLAHRHSRSGCRGPGTGVVVTSLMGRPAEMSVGPLLVEQWPERAPRPTHTAGAVQLARPTGVSPANQTPAVPVGSAPPPPPAGVVSQAASALAPLSPPPSGWSEVSHLPSQPTVAPPLARSDGVPGEDADSRALPPPAQPQSTRSAWDLSPATASDASSAVAGDGVATRDGASLPLPSAHTAASSDILASPLPSDAPASPVAVVIPEPPPLLVSAPPPRRRIAASPPSFAPPAPLTVTASALPAAAAAQAGVLAPPLTGAVGAGALWSPDQPAPQAAAAAARLAMATLTASFRGPDNALGQAAKRGGDAVSNSGVGGEVDTEIAEAHRTVAAIAARALIQRSAARTSEPTADPVLSAAVTPVLTGPGGGHRSAASAAVEASGHDGADTLPMQLWHSPVASDGAPDTTPPPALAARVARATAGVGAASSALAGPTPSALAATASPTTSVVGSVPHIFGNAAPVHHPPPLPLPQPPRVFAAAAAPLAARSPAPATPFAAGAPAGGSRAGTALAALSQATLGTNATTRSAHRHDVSLLGASTTHHPASAPSQSLTSPGVRSPVPRHEPRSATAPAAPFVVGTASTESPGLPEAPPKAARAPLVRTASASTAAAGLASQPRGPAPTTAAAVTTPAMLAASTVLSPVAASASSPQAYHPTIFAETMAPLSALGPSRAGDTWAEPPAPAGTLETATGAAAEATAAESGLCLNKAYAH